MAKYRNPPRRIMLTSSGLTKPTFKHAFTTLLKRRKPEGNPKVLYVPDAAVGNFCDAQDMFNYHVNQFMRLGVTRVECVELLKTTPAQLTAHLQGADCVYVDMGNTFYLRYYMRTSGFDRMVPSLVKNAGLVFVGASAGSMCAGSTISIAFWKGWDNPGRGEEWDLQDIGYQGLDILPRNQAVFPHYSDQWRPLVESKSQTTDHEVVILDEDHMYIVEGEHDYLAVQLPMGPF